MTFGDHLERIRALLKLLFTRERALPAKQPSVFVVPDPDDPARVVALLVMYVGKGATPVEAAEDLERQLAQELD